MELVLCYICWMTNWRKCGRFLGDIPPEAQGELCAECHGMVAVIRADVPILERAKPTVQKKLDLIWDFTTYTRRELYKFATCIFFTRGEGDRIEVYLDEIAAASFEAQRRLAPALGLNPEDMPEPYELLIFLIDTSVVHEWLHHEAGLEERPARFGTEHVLKALTHPGWPGTATSLANMVWVLSRGRDAPHIEPPEETAN
jgi:hypothetical protein